MKKFLIKTLNQFDLIDGDELIGNINTSGTYFYGICSVVWHMYNMQIIKYTDKVGLLNYLRENAPKNRYAKDCIYWWKPGNKIPRINWIKKQIEKL